MGMIQMLNDARDGYFHEFYHDQDRSYGVIEFLDGKIEVINIKEFKFKEPPLFDVNYLPQCIPSYPNPYFNPNISSIVTTNQS